MCTNEPNNNNIIYLRINGPAYSASKSILVDGSYTTITLAQAMADVMNASYRFGILPGDTVPIWFLASGILTSSTITICNTDHKLRILTDNQAGALISSGSLELTAL